MASCAEAPSNTLSAHCETHRYACAYILEEEVSGTVIVQDLHPIYSTLGDIDESHARRAFADYQGVDTNVVRPDP